MRNILLLLICILLLSCKRDYSKEILTALELSGNNRNEIEKVLKHYNDSDKKKFDAACFLISNMQYHKSEAVLTLDSAYHYFFHGTDSLYRSIFQKKNIRKKPWKNPKQYDELRKSRGEYFSHFPKPISTSNSLTDLQIVSSDFLIDNIEKAFEEWENNPLLNDMSFEDFKEFVLPYRTSDEELLMKRSEIQQTWRKIIAKNGFSNITIPLERYKYYVEKSRWLNEYTSPENHLGVYDLFVPKYKNKCHNLTNWTCNILRACGIPVVYEYTTQWKNRSGMHFWCVSPDSMGILQPYTAPDNNLKEDWHTNIMYASKVYRKGFAANKKSPYFFAFANEYIPENLASPLLQDQTFRYHQTITLRMSCSKIAESNLAYLCMFDGFDLVPVGWGKIDKRSDEVVFEQVPLNTVFVPAYYVDEDLISFSCPFMISSSGDVAEISLPLTTNENKEIIECRIKHEKLFCKSNSKIESKLSYVPVLPDGQITENMLLLRKYPEKKRLKIMQENLVGAYFTGSNDETKYFDTLFTLTEVPVPYIQEVCLNNKKPYRYYRFFSSDKSPLNIAHMEYLGNYSNFHSCSKPTPLPVLSKSDTAVSKSNLYRINGIPQGGLKPEVAFDNNLETYARVSSVGMDFSKPVVISSVRLIPRTANNTITVNDTYRLFFHDGKRWKEHETVKAKYNYIEIKNVPSGTLYWLQNLTHGKEEHPFFYKDGCQYFMNMESPF